MKQEIESDSPDCEVRRALESSSVETIDTASSMGHCVAATPDFWAGPPVSWLDQVGSSPRVRFVSDLHLLSPRSRSQPLSTYVDPRASDALILGGDIFDFRWSSLCSIRESVEAAIHAVRQLLESTDLPIAYLLGNHDCLARYVTELSKLDLEFPHFALVHHHMQLGDTAFLHGDVLDAMRRSKTTSVTTVHEKLMNYRAGFEHTTTRSKLTHTAYDVAVAMRVHRAIPRLVRTQKRTVESLAELLELLQPEEFPHLRRICFGHTHRAIESARAGNIEFLNGGACLRHMPHRAIDVRIGDTA